MDFARWVPRFAGTVDPGRSGWTMILPAGVGSLAWPAPEVPMRSPNCFRDVPLLFLAGGLMAAAGCYESGQDAQQRLLEAREQAEASTTADEAATEANDVPAPEENRAEQAWAALAADADAAALRAFIDSHPDSPRAAEARDKLAEMAAAAYKQAEVSGNPSSYRTFLDDHPEADAKLRQAAAEKLEAMTELADWKAALRERKAELFERFVTDHPGSARVDQAGVWLELAKAADLSSVVMIYGETTEVCEKGVGAFSFTPAEDLRMDNFVFPAGSTFSMGIDRSIDTTKSGGVGLIQKPERIDKGRKVLVYFGWSLADKKVWAEAEMAGMPPLGMMSLPMAVLEVAGEEAVEGVGNLGQAQPR